MVESLFIISLLVGIGLKIILVMMLISGGLWSLLDSLNPSHSFCFRELTHEEKVQLFFMCIVWRTTEDDLHRLACLFGIPEKQVHDELYGVSDDVFDEAWEMAMELG